MTLHLLVLLLTMGPAIEPPELSLVASLQTMLRDKDVGRDLLCARLREAKLAIKDKVGPDWEAIHDGLREIARQAHCPMQPGASSPRPRLWERFVKARATCANAADRDSRTRCQLALQLTAIPLLHELSPGDSHFADLLSSLALYVAPGDVVIILDRVLDDLASRNLSGDELVRVVRQVADILNRVDVDNLGPGQLGNLLDLLVRIHKRKPGILKQVSLDPDQGVALAETFLRFIERTKLDSLPAEQRESVLRLVDELVRAVEEGSADAKDLLAAWRDSREILSATRNPKARRLVRQALEEVCGMDESCGKMDAELAKANPDPSMVEGLLSGLGRARASEIRRRQAALARQEIPLKPYLSLQTVVTKRLPERCAREEGEATCAAALRFAKQFRDTVIGGSLEWGFEQTIPSLPLTARLDYAECVLSKKPLRSDLACPAKNPITGQFSAAVALDIHEDDGIFVAEAGCVVHSSNAPSGVSRLPVVRSDLRDWTGDNGNEALLAGQRLAETVLKDCGSVMSIDDGSSATIKAAREPSLLRLAPSPASALLFAGLPWQGRPETTGKALAFSVADGATLMGSVASLLGGVYCHNMDARPWDDRLLQAGIVAAGINVAIKLLSLGLALPRPEGAP